VAEEPTPAPISQRPIPWDPRAVTVVVAIAVVVLVFLALIAADHIGPFAQPSSGPPTEYTIQGTSIAFVGNAANDFEVSPAYTCTTYVCGSGQSGQTIYVPVGVAMVSTAGGCTPQYEVAQVSASQSGAFVVTKVIDVTNASDIHALPAVVPTAFANGGCSWAAVLGVTVQVVAQGPSVQTLYLTVSVSTYP
jgi:hypothetical protein